MEVRPRGRAAISKVLLIGGATRMPAARRFISHMTGLQPEEGDVDPDEAVALGAAVQAGILQGEVSNLMVMVRCRGWSVWWNWAACVFQPHSRRRVTRILMERRGVGRGSDWLPAGGWSTWQAPPRLPAPACLLHAHCATSFWLSCAACAQTPPALPRRRTSGRRRSCVRSRSCS